MIMLIGGSSSTGSSLLNQLLGRHPRMTISEESSLFARPQLITEWSKYKDRIIRSSPLRPLKSYGWHRENGVTIPYNSWQINRDRLGDMIQKHSRFSQFVKELKQDILTNQDTNVWAEKTPADALAMDLVSKLRGDTFLVSMLRHPLEAVASMVFRGYHPIYACCIYLLNTAFALSTDSNRKSIVKYEDLVDNYELVIEELLSNVGLRSVEIDWKKVGILLLYFAAIIIISMSIGQLF